MQILVVEDDAFMRILLSAALKGVDLIEAWRLEDAIDLACAQHPDVIVVDRRLPDGDGLDLVRELRTDPATADTPILLLTATHDERDRAQVLEAGADEYLSKVAEKGDLAGVGRRIDRLMAMGAEARSARRADHLARCRAGETGDPDPLPGLEVEPDRAAPRRRWPFSRRRDG